MTIQSLIDWFNAYEFIILGYFLGILLLSIVVTYSANPNNVNRLKYVLSALVFGVTIPGVLAAMLVLYTLLILRSSLLEVSIVAYFVPVIAMILTLVILNRKVRMSQIPGFGKLSSLILIIFISFGIVFVLLRTHFGVLFIGSIIHLFIIFAVVFFILKAAWTRLTK